MAFDQLNIGSVAGAGDGEDRFISGQKLNALIAAANAGQFQGFKNRIINGGFDIWQRGTGFIAANLYTVDRWYYRQPNTGSGDVTRQTHTPGQESGAGPYFARVTRLGDASWFGQRIEGIHNLAGKQVAVTVRAKAASAYALPVKMTASHGSGGSADATVTLSSINLTTSWQTFVVTGTVPSISGKTIGAGSNLLVYFGQAGSDNVSVDIDFVQLEVGAVGTQFETRPVALEMALCQRYFERISAAGQSRHTIAIGAAYSSTMVFGSLRYARKRTNPTITAAGTIGFFANNTVINASATAFNHAGVDGAEVQLTVSGATQGHAGHVRWNNDTAGYIDISAEL